MSTVQLRRIDPTQNMARFSPLPAQPILWDEWPLVRAWYRIGRPGTVHQTTDRTPDETAAAPAQVRHAKLKRGYQPNQQK